MTKVTDRESTKVVKVVNGYEIEKSVEITVNCFDEVKGKEVFYGCVYDDTLCETFSTLKEAVEYCKTH